MEFGKKIIMGYDPLGWGGTFMESGKRNFVMGYYPLGWGGEHSWNQKDFFLESGKRIFIMGYDPLGSGGGNINGIRKKFF